MKYLFILGRNPDLSKAEIFSYFKNSKNKILSYSIKKNGLLIDLEKSIEKNIIENFGGVISIGKVLIYENIKNLENEIESIIIYSGKENKLNYVLWNFSKSSDFVRAYLKKRFKKEKIKATFKHLTGNVKLQEGKNARKPSSKLINEEYFVFDEGETIYFGKIIEKCDYSSIGKRDIEKPIRRESLAISPRLAKIMINLAQPKRGEILIDPFCGVGTILQEALLRNFKVMGIDKDKNVIKSAEKNLKWFNFSEKNYSLINSDSTNAEIPEVSVMVTEPDLGETLKKIPTREKAQKMIKKFESLMIKTVNNLKKKVFGKIVFSSPYIRIGKKRLSVNIKNILKRTGLNLVYEGIPEFRENQIVGRMIYVLEK